MAANPGRILFLIPARGGSRRLPGKNLLPVAGIPLVGGTIRVARQAAAEVPGGPHRVVCSTEDPAIAEVARAWGADVIERPAELATDAASSADVALHAIGLEIAAGRPPATLVLVQPTSPLTDPADVVAAIERHRRERVPVVAVTQSHPVGFHRTLGPGDTIASAVGGAAGLPLGEGGGEALLAGAFYVIAPDDLRASGTFSAPDRTVGWVIPPERAVDVDEPLDLLVAEAAAAARPMRDVSVADARLGRGRAFVIAEAGVNHDGRLEQAHRLVEAAADAGADAVKFQTFDPDLLAAPGAPRAEYQARRAGRDEDQRAMLARLALPPDAWPQLQRHAIDLGLTFLSTPFDEPSAALLDSLGVPAFKVGSGELTNLPFLSFLAAYGRPLLVSTGMADMVEVAAAVDAIAEAGNPPLALLHCVSAYPAAPEDANLRAIETLRRAFGVPVGWSDHMTGIETSVAAAALGAAIIEKHLTLDRALPGPDHAASLEPAAFRAMVGAIREVESAVGEGIKRPAAAEAEIAAVARRSLHWSVSLAAGEVIEPSSLVALRPGTGLPPHRAAGIVGRRTARPVAAGRPVAAEDVARDT